MQSVLPIQLGDPDATKVGKSLQQPDQELSTCCNKNANGADEAFNYKWHGCFDKQRKWWRRVLLLGAAAVTAAMVVVGTALYVGCFKESDGIAFHVQPTASLTLAAADDKLIRGDFQKDGAVLHFAIDAAVGLLNLSYSSGKSNSGNGGFLVVVRGEQQATCAWVGLPPLTGMLTWLLVGEPENTTMAVVTATADEVLRLPMAGLVAQAVRLDQAAPGNVTELVQVQQLLAGDLGTALQQLSIKLGASGFIGSQNSTSAASRLHMLARHAALLQGGKVALPAKEVGFVNDFVQQQHMDNGEWHVEDTDEQEREEEEEEAELASTSRGDAMSDNGTRRLWSWRRRRRLRAPPSSSECPTGVPVDACGNSKFGMCGLGDSCWRWVCGTCCCHKGCQVHDKYCSCHGIWHWRCHQFVDFWRYGCGSCQR